MIDICYPQTFRRPTSDLRRTCWQTHKDVQALLSTIDRTQRPRCKLDLRVMEDDVWPMWIIPPTLLSSEVYDLDVHLRLFDVRDANLLFRTNGWPEVVSQPLMVILNRLLYYGPQFLDPIPGLKGLFIHTLTMDIHHCVTNSVGPCAIRYRNRITPENIFCDLYSFMTQLEAQGYLYGKVHYMRLMSEKKALNETAFIY